ncbi:MAG TPA: ankyrin repeat domain-containing protein [Pirellulales bacterium]
MRLVFGIAGLLVALLCALCFVLAADAPLADAVEKADAAKIEALLNNKTIDVNAAQIDGMTALDWAAYHDNLPLAKRLLAAGASANVANRFGVTPLSIGCTNGNTAIVELLLAAGANPEAALRGGETPLMTAARTGKLGPVLALLERDVDVNAKERKGQTAIMWAAAEGNTAVVQALLAASAEFKQPLPSGYTPLFFAVREGKVETVQALLQAGADVNEAMQPAKKPSGKSPVVGTSPLILAIENGHFELAAMLLDAGANPNDLRSGFSPLHTLTWVRKPNRGDGDDGVPPPIGSGKLTSLELAASLVKHGADVNLQLKHGSAGKGALGKIGLTPFMMASATADLPYMRALVELGADPKLTNAQHCTPLLAAAGVGVTAPEETAGDEPDIIEAIQYLLTLEADVNAVDDNGETALHGAAYRCFPKVAQLLIDKGAKIDVWNRANKLGWTPQQICQGKRVSGFKPSPETLAVLEKALAASGPPNSAPDNPPSQYSDDAKKAAE